MSGLPSMSEQAALCAMSAEPERQAKYNSGHFLPGIRSGSTTERVLDELKKMYPRWMEHCELMEACQASRGAVSWAVRYLMACGDVMAFRSSRHPSYLRYRAKKDVA